MTAAGAGLLIALAGCGKKDKREDIGPEADAAVAQLERLQRGAPVPIMLQPVGRAQAAVARLDGAGCQFTPGAGDGAPVLVADSRVAVLRAANAAMIMAVDPGATPERPHFVGKTHTVRIDRSPGPGEPLGDEGESWRGVLTVEDADHRTVCRTAGRYACSG